MHSNPAPTGSHPDAETLAVFAEGRLDDLQRRRQVIEHLADCVSCSEAVADAMAFLREAEGEDDEAEVVPLRRTTPPGTADGRRGGRIPAWAWTMAAILTLMLLGAGALLFGPQDRMHRHGDLLVADSTELLAPWSDAQRSAAAGILRPEDGALGFSDSPEARGFALGVRLTDARVVSMAAGASMAADATVRSAAFARLAEGLVDLPGFSDAVDGLEDSNSPFDSLLDEIEDRLADVPEERLPAFSLAFGRFVEATRLAAAVGATEFFAQEAFARTLADLRQHRLSPEVRKRLEALPTGDGEITSARFEQVERSLAEIIEIEGR